MFSALVTVRKKDFCIVVAKKERKGHDRASLNISVYMSLHSTKSPLNLGNVCIKCSYARHGLFRQKKKKEEKARYILLEGIGQRS